MKIKPFRGIRPPKDLAKQVSSRPYDVLNSEEARKEAEGNPYSLLHVTKAEIDLPAGTDEHSPEVYLQVVKNFNSFKDFGWLKRDEEDKLYIYAQSMNPTDANAHWQYGIVACAYSEDYVNKIIKKALDNRDSACYNSFQEKEVLDCLIKESNECINC